MAETISFSKDGLTDKTTNIKKFEPKTGILKYTANNELPKYEDKNVLIFTDKNELWRGNGYGFPLSQINLGSVTIKDLVFVCFGIDQGVLEPEILFPYLGIIRNIHVSFSSSTPPMSRFIIDLECLRNNSWIAVKRLFIESNQTSLIETTEFKIDNEILRLNVIEAQNGGLNNIVVIVKIDI